jgi:hypothetical protein
MSRSFFLPVTFLLALPAIARAGEFTVIDDRAETEVSEVSRLYIDGNLAATFRLGSGVDRVTSRIQTPMGRVNHDYALCGEITIVNAEGRHETHQVSSEGILHNPDGHVFEALGADNFTDFYLADPADPSAVEHRAGRARACAQPIT